MGKVADVMIKNWISPKDDDVVKLTGVQNKVYVGSKVGSKVIAVVKGIIILGLLLYQNVVY